MSIKKIDLKRKAAQTINQKLLFLYMKIKKIIKALAPIIIIITIQIIA